MPNKLVDLTGQRFGRLTVVGRAPENDKSRKALWNCACACGRTAMAVRGFDLRMGNTTSCGCYKYLATRKPDDQIGYDAAHDRVAVAKGRATEHACIDCSGPGAEWSLRHDAPVTYLGWTGKDDAFACRFSGNPDDYDPRCGSCHRTYDLQGDSACRM